MKLLLIAALATMVWGCASESSTSTIGSLAQGNGAW